MTSPTKVDAFVISVTEKEVRSAIQEFASRQLKNTETGGPIGDYRFALMEPDGYRGFKVIFVKSQVQKDKGV